MNEKDPYLRDRLRMVESHLVPRGIGDPRVLAAFRKVPRHEFVPPERRGAADADHPLPIGMGQTISQPFMVALMTRHLALSGGERVLEIGTGSGYQTAILAELAGEVYSVERIASLSERAGGVLDRLGYTNVRLRVGDGTLGWPEAAPFDGVIVTAGAPRVPDPLKEQLAEGGRLVIPVGGAFSQSLLVFTRRGKKFGERDEGGCVFVPLIGEYGWEGDG